MTKYTFTCVLEIDPESFMDTPQKAVDFALTWGYGKQDFYLYTVGPIKVEETEGE